MKKLVLVFFFLALVPSLLLAQEQIKNDDVVKLVKAGFSDDFIIKTINSKTRDFKTDLASLLALKQAGVSESILDVMSEQKIEKSVSLPAPSPVLPVLAKTAPVSVFGDTSRSLSIEDRMAVIKEGASLIFQITKVDLRRNELTFTSLQNFLVGDRVVIHKGAVARATSITPLVLSVPTTADKNISMDYDKPAESLVGAEGEAIKAHAHDYYMLVWKEEQLPLVTLNR